MDPENNKKPVEVGNSSEADIKSDVEAKAATPINEAVTPAAKPKKKSGLKKLLIPIVAVLALAGIGGGAWAYVEHNKPVNVLARAFSNITKDDKMAAEISFKLEATSDEKTMKEVVDLMNSSKAQFMLDKNGKTINYNLVMNSNGFAPRMSFVMTDSLRKANFKLKYNESDSKALRKMLEKYMVGAPSRMSDQFDQMDQMIKMFSNKWYYLDIDNIAKEQTDKDIAECREAIADVYFGDVIDSKPLKKFYTNHPIIKAEEQDKEDGYRVFKLKFDTDELKKLSEKDFKDFKFDNKKFDKIAEKCEMFDDEEPAESATETEDEPEDKEMKKAVEETDVLVYVKGDKLFKMVVKSDFKGEASDPIRFKEFIINFDVNLNDFEQPKDAVSLDEMMKQFSSEM